jgi:hypothetical protein
MQNTLNNSIISIRVISYNHCNNVMQITKSQNHRVYGIFPLSGNPNNQKTESRKVGLFPSSGIETVTHEHGSRSILQNVVISS